MVTDSVEIAMRRGADLVRERSHALRDRANDLRNHGHALRAFADAVRDGGRSLGHVPRTGEDRAERGPDNFRPDGGRPRLEAISTTEMEIPLPGGDMTEGVVRVDETVRRPVRSHTAAVHELLRHLEAVGFEGAPRVLGIDEKNREILTYLHGDVPRRPLPGYALTESTLVALADLQRRYHEAVASFEPPPWACWDGEITRYVDGPPELICHCDVNLENVIFSNGSGEPRPYAFIDFDLARPGTRLVDIIQTLRYWAPIADPVDRAPALRDLNAADRIAIFCQAYGLSYLERARLASVASRWLRRSPASIARRARAGGDAWARMLDAGVGERLMRAAAWIERNRPEIEARLR